MAAERELIYRIKVVSDPENGKALREHVSAAKRAEDTIVSMRHENLRKAATEAKLARTQEESDARNFAMNRVRILRASEDLERRQREQSRTDTRQHLDRVEKAWTESQRRIKSGQASLTESLAGTTEGVARLIRGVAMIGVVGEASSEKLLRNLVKIQAGFDVMVGSARLLQNLGKGAGAIGSLLGGSGGRAMSATALSMLGGGGISGNLGIENAFTLGPGGAASSLASGALTNVGEFGAGRITSRLTKSRAAKNLIGETISTIIGDTLGEVGSDVIRSKMTKKATSEAGEKVIEAVIGGVLQTVTMRNMTNRSVAGKVPTILRYAEGDALWRKAGGALAEAGAGGLGGNYFNRVPGMGGGDFTRFGATQGVAARVAASGMTGGVSGVAGSGFYAGATSLGGLGAGAAAAASLAVALKVLTESVSGNAKNIDSWSMKIAESEVGFVKWLDRLGIKGEAMLTGKTEEQVAKSGSGFSLGSAWAALSSFGITTSLGGVSNAGAARREVLDEEREKRWQGQQIAKTRREMIAEAMAGVSTTGRMQQESSLSRLTDQAESPRERIRRLMGEERFNSRSLRENASSLAGASTESDRSSLLTESARLYERMAEISERRLSAERQLISEQRNSIQERISGAEKELELSRTRIRENKDSLRSSAERFGDLSNRDKARAIQAMRQARTGGAASLNREQRNLLRTVGGIDATRAASDSSVAEARRGGFFSVFGTTEGRNIAEGEAAEKKLAMQIKDDRNLVVQIDRDDEKLARTTVQAINKALAQRDEILLRKIREAAEEAQRQIALTTDAQIQQRAESQSNRRNILPQR